jgi:hypothetical protein
MFFLGCVLAKLSTSLNPEEESLMARGELLRKLFLNYSRGDNDGFRTTAQEIIDNEESRNNRALASSLRRSLEASNILSGNSQRKLEIVPFEKDKQLPLVE